MVASSGDHPQPCEGHSLASVLWSLGPGCPTHCLMREMALTLWPESGGSGPVWSARGGRTQTNLLNWLVVLLCACFPLPQGRTPPTFFPLSLPNLRQHFLPSSILVWNSSSLPIFLRTTVRGSTSYFPTSSLLFPQPLPTRPQQAVSRARGKGLKSPRGCLTPPSAAPDLFALLPLL